MARPQPNRYQVKNHGKYNGSDIKNIICRSSWERVFCRYCDFNNSVLKWSSESVVIPYYSSVHGKAKRYYPDFLVKQYDSDGKIETVLVEVKPHKETIPPKKKLNKRSGKPTVGFLRENVTYQVNSDKWKAAQKHCKKMGWRFLIMDEYKLGLKKIQRGKK